MEHNLQLAKLLNALCQRALANDEPDLSPAIGIVNDLGHVILNDTEFTIRHAQAAAGAVYQQLLDGACANDALTGPDGRAFLAGALWAVCEIMTQSLNGKESNPSEVE